MTSSNFSHAVKGHKGYSDGTEALYQGKIDNSLHSAVTDNERVCYFLKTLLIELLFYNSKLLRSENE